MPITTLQATPSKLPSIISAVICIIFALLSLFLFWSSVLTVRPEAVITQWEQNKKEVNQELAITMIARLKQSIAINPLDANSHLLIAKYYEILALTKPNKYAELAENEYKQTIKHQPSWGYAWGKLAKFYNNQEQLSEANFMYALSKAMLLGPYERKNQAVMIPLLFKHWSLIKNSKQKQAKKLIKHAVKYSNEHFLLSLNIAIKNKQLEILAPLLTKEWHKDTVIKYLKEETNE